LRRTIESIGGGSRCKQGPNHFHDAVHEGWRSPAAFFPRSKVMQIAAVPATSRWNQPDAWTGRAVTFQSNRRRSPFPGNGILERTDLAVFSLLLLHSRVCRRTAFKYCACNGTSGTGQRERGSELASASNVECVSGKREFATRDKGAERVELIMRMIELSARRHCQQSAEGDGKKGRWVHQHANGPSSWRRDARHFGSTQPRLLMRNCGIGFNLAQISCPTPNITRLTSHWI
jgi:hypothetical protein